MRRSLAALALAVVLPLPGLLPAAVLAGVVVKPGETLSEIADRNGISLKRLMQANGITNPDVVTAGQTLVIPGSGSGGSSTRSYGSTGGSSGSGTITVQDGDTLSEIADRAGISVNRLMRLNGLSDANKLSIGQKLVVGGGGNGGGGGYTRQAAAAKPLPTAPYTVKKGETVSELAERFGTTTNRLLALNNISDPKLLVAGTRIAIPGRPSSPATSSRAASSSARAASPSGEHVVASGESLSHIADRYNTSVERLVAINKIGDPDLVVAGTRLKLQAPPAPKPAPKQVTRPAAKASVTTKPAATSKPVQQAAKPVQPAAKSTALAKAPETKPAEAKPAVGSTKAAPTTTISPTATATATATQPKVEAKPVIAAKPAQATQRVVETKPAVEAKPVAEAKPVVETKRLAETKPVVATKAVVETKPVEAKPAATTVATAQITSKPVTTTASRPAVSRSRPLGTKANGPDWRSYGPLQVDWANWQSMGGSYVAPTLNGQGQPLYLAINCGARKLNTTTQSGQWKTWDAPQAEFEQQLVSDLCKAKGG
jgi:LysM repeat protein